MGNKLYVGNLPFDIGGKGLEELFAPAGVCESAAVINHHTDGYRESPDVIR